MIIFKYKWNPCTSLLKILKRYPVPFRVRTKVPTKALHFLALHYISNLPICSLPHSLCPICGLLTVPLKSQAHCCHRAFGVPFSKLSIYLNSLTSFKAQISPFQWRLSKLSYLILQPAHPYSICLTLLCFHHSLTHYTTYLLAMLIALFQSSRIEI